MSEAPHYPATCWALVEQSAARGPELPMLQDEQGRTLTFGQFRRAAEEVAAGLADRGITAGTVVSWILPTVLEGFVLMAALARLGVIQNPIVPNLRHREVSLIMAQVRPQLVVVPGVWRGLDYAQMVRDVTADLQAPPQILEVDTSRTEGLGLPWGDPSSLPPAPTATPARDEQSVRWLYYSSGTTAEPKGIRHTDFTVMNAATGLIEGLQLSPADLYPVAFPVTHIGGVAMFTAQLMTSCRIACVEKFDATSSPRYMAAAGATILGSALPFIHAYLRFQQSHGAERVFTKLRTCVSGGAPKPLELHREVKAVLGGVGVTSSWGLTEFPIATHCRLDDPDEVLEASEGRPVSGISLRVVGADGAAVDPGGEGELRLKGPQLFMGYVDSQLDAAAFDDEGWFRTGDLGVVDPSGAVRITGRLKDVIVRNAENISAKEVEDILYLHPQVADVAVIGLPDPRTGERCCAVIVAAPGADKVTLEKLSAHCLGLGLAQHKLPERLVLVGELPRNSMGKVLKAELRAHYATL
jgi:acyl-CoA synthetase (AMP-forming)/AMP-acid ligase II